MVRRRARGARCANGGTQVDPSGSPGEHGRRQNAKGVVAEWSADAPCPAQTWFPGRWQRLWFSTIVTSCFIILVKYAARFYATKEQFKGSVHKKKKKIKGGEKKKKKKKKKKKS